MLVLCKIYKAHSNSRSSTARKRKPTDELLNQVSSPVKAKRRLFDSPGPISSAAASQERVSSKTCYELAALHREIESKPSQDEAEPETSHKQVRSYQLSSRLESLCSGLVHKPLQDEEAKPEEADTLQEKLSARASYNLQLQGKSNATLDSAFRSELDPSQDKVLYSAFRSELEQSQDKISEFIIQRFWTEADKEVTEEPEASQEKLSSRASYNSQLQGKSNATLDSAFRSEIEPSQDKASESIIQRFWTEAVTEATEEASQEKLLQVKSNATLDSALRSKLEPLQDMVSESIIQRLWTSEIEASQLDRATVNCNFLMAGGAPTMPVHYAPETALSSTSWTGNDITASCSSELGWFVGGAPPMPSHCAPGALFSASWMGNDITASCSSELGWVFGAPTYNEFGCIAGGGFTSEPDVRSMPFAPVPPAAVAP